MPFWALFALLPCAVASDHSESYGPGDPPSAGTLARGSIEVDWHMGAPGDSGFIPDSRAPCVHTPLCPKWVCHAVVHITKPMWTRLRTRPPALSEVSGPFGPQTTQRVHVSQLIPMKAAPGAITRLLFQTGTVWRRP